MYQDFAINVMSVLIPVISSSVGLLSLIPGCNPPGMFVQMGNESNNGKEA